MNETEFTPKVIPTEIVGLETLFRYDQKDCKYCMRRISRSCHYCPCCGYPQNSKLLNGDEAK